MHLHMNKPREAKGRGFVASGFIRAVPFALSMIRMSVPQPNNYAGDYIKREI